MGYILEGKVMTILLEPTLSMGLVNGAVWLCAIAGAVAGYEKFRDRIWRRRMNIKLVKWYNSNLHGRIRT